MSGPPKNKKKPKPIKKRKRSNSSPASPQKTATEGGITGTTSSTVTSSSGSDVASPDLSGSDVQARQTSTSQRTSTTNRGASESPGAETATNVSPPDKDAAAPRLPRKRRNTISGLGANDDLPEVDVDALTRARRKKQGDDDQGDDRPSLSEPAEQEEGPEPRVDHVEINSGDRKRRDDEDDSEDEEEITVVRRIDEDDPDTRQKKVRSGSSDPDGDSDDEDDSDDDQSGAAAAGQSKAKKKKKKKEADKPDEEKDRPAISEKDRTRIDALKGDYKISDNDIKNLETQIKKIRTEGVNWESAMKMFGDDPDFQEIFEDRMKRPVDAEESEGMSDRFLRGVKGDLTAENALKTAAGMLPVAGSAISVAGALIKRSTAKDKKRITRVFANLEANPIVKAISGPLYAKHRKEQISATVSAAVGVVSTAQSVGGHLTSAPLTIGGAVAGHIAAASKDASAAVGGGLAGMAAEQAVGQLGKLPDKLTKLAVKEGVPKLEGEISGVSSTGTERTRAFLEFLGMKSRLPLLEKDKQALKRGGIKSKQVMDEMLRLEIRRSLGMMNDDEDLLDRAGYKKDREKTKKALNAVRLPGVAGEFQDKLTEFSQKQEYLNGTDGELETYNKLKKATRSKEIAEKEAALNDLRSNVMIGGGMQATPVVIEPDEAVRKRKMQTLETEIAALVKEEARDLEESLKGANMLAFLFKTEGLFIDGENRYRKTKGYRRLLDEKVGYKANLQKIDRDKTIENAIEAKQAQLNSLYKREIVPGVMGGALLKTLPSEKQAEAQELSEEINSLKQQLVRQEKGKEDLRKGLKRGISNTERNVLARQIQEKETERNKLRNIRLRGGRHGAVVDETSPANRAEIAKLEQEIKDLKKQQQDSKERFAFPKRK